MQVKGKIYNAPTLYSDSIYLGNPYDDNDVIKVAFDELCNCF